MSYESVGAGWTIAHEYPRIASANSVTGRLIGDAANKAAAGTPSSVGEQPYVPRVVNLLCLLETKSSSEPSYEDGELIMTVTHATSELRCISYGLCICERWTNAPQPGLLLGFNSTNRLLSTRFTRIKKSRSTTICE